MERFVFVTDSESSHVFTDNMPYHFKVQLKLPLHFDGYWTVSLREISIQTANKKISQISKTTLFIYSNICKESIVNGGEHALLRRIDKNGVNSWKYVFDSPFYLPLQKSEIQELEFVIKTGDGDFASFVSSPLYLTLHFKRHPFYPNYESI